MSTAHSDFDGHELIVHCHDRTTGLRAIVAVHDTSLGSGMGGCRMQLYNTEDEAVGDALRLSRGMTYKYAAAGLPYGGAKAVIIADPSRGKTTALLDAFADFVERLGGEYVTAEDSGTDTSDIRRFSARTSHVRNLPLEGDGDGALCTAWGVFHAITTALEYRGRPKFAGSLVAVEGLGKVGAELCRLLHQAGADLLVSDLDRDRVTACVEQFGARAIPVGSAHKATADVYAPCALGGALNFQTISELAAGIVAGAANNQLAAPSCGELLRDRGILYCPDYVVNAGGVLGCAPKGQAYERAAALDRVASVRTTLAEVLRIADTNNTPTNVAADRLVEARLALARKEHQRYGPKDGGKRLS